MNTALIVTAAYLLVRRSTAPRWLRVIAGAAAVARSPRKQRAGAPRQPLAERHPAASRRRRVTFGASTIGVCHRARGSPRRHGARRLRGRLLRSDGADHAAVGARRRRPPRDGRGRSRSSTTLRWRRPGAATHRHRIRGATVLKMALQAQCVIRPRECCASVATTINQWEAPPLTITSLWHEFHLAPPPCLRRRQHRRAAAQGGAAAAADARGRRSVRARERL